ncbi:hypothetical protein [Desulfamplus magnetovallimortis]|nr:hypothetical protein [Desulfamplus magnetovallimortis]
MSNSITVFISGIVGVFFGMAFLYISMKTTALVIDRLEKGKEEKQS